MRLQLAALFQNHAVLQRGRMLPVWGWAHPGAWVHVRLGNHHARTLASESGDFLVRLPRLSHRGPHTLEVATPETGERLEIVDLLAGEVWLASGQSNMQWTLEKSRPLSNPDIANADFPDIRFFTVATRAHLGVHRQVEGNWQLATPEAAGAFSAVAFAFARKIFRELGVPVGIISSSWAGSIIQAWLSRSALAENPDVSARLENYERLAWTAPHWDRLLSAGGRRVPIDPPADPGNRGLEQGWHRPEFDDSGWGKISLPGTWQSAGHWNSGVYWFRKRIPIPTDWIGRELEVHLGAIDKQDISYANGREIGRTGREFEATHWNVPRVYRLPAALVDGLAVDLAVRAYSFLFYGGLIGPEDEMRIHPAEDPAASLSLSGEWQFACEHDLGLVTETYLQGHAEYNSPHILYDNMIQPLAPYALGGVIWYQGEGNANSFGIYAKLLRGLIRDWRHLWGQPDLPFHLVQLPNYQAPQDHQSDSQWARLREAQVAALAEPHAGLAVTIDLGEAGDLHPKDKMPVGERLAQSALVDVYGIEGQARGPIFSGLVIENDKVRCRFRHAGSGLTTTDGQAPHPFYLAAENGPFFPAQAQIDGSDLLVWSDQVPSPSAVRYAWADNPAACNLAGATGLPASPFRSDKRL